MKAYVYRSGHVMIGPSVPSGAIELAEWDNEAELLTVLRWLTSQVEDAEGSPCMALKFVGISGNERAAFQAAIYTRTRIQDGLRILRELPQGRAIMTVGPIEGWSPELLDRINAA
jgi:hypothetical protein